MAFWEAMDDIVLASGDTETAAVLQLLKEQKLIAKGTRVIFTQGNPYGAIGSTNTLKMLTI